MKRKEGKNFIILLHISFTEHNRTTSEKGKIMTIRNYITNFSNAMCSTITKLEKGIIQKCTELK